MQIESHYFLSVERKLIQVKFGFLFQLVQLPIQRM